MAGDVGDLGGKVAIVTGAGSIRGIGAVTARTLARAGARIILADLPTSAVEETTRALAAEGLAVASCPADITDEESVKALMRFTQERYDRLDILDNNAANQANPDDLDVATMPVELWDRIMGVNARGTMLMCKHAVPLMVASGGGSIVNISSGTAQAGDIYATAYACSKGAINTLTKYVATQYGSKGIRCNAIAAGLVNTPMLASGMPGWMQDIFRSHSLGQTLGEPQDIAEMVLFLASPRARFVTGQVLPVDGGLFAHIPTTVQVAQHFAQGE